MGAAASVVAAKDVSEITLPERVVERAAALKQELVLLGGGPELRSSVNSFVDELLADLDTT